MAKNCLAYCSGGAAQRLLEIAGNSLPVIPILTQFQIRFDSIHVRKQVTQSHFWSLPLGWGLSCEMTLQQIPFWTAGSLLSQEFWLIYISRIGVSKIIPIFSIMMMVLSYLNSHLLSAAKGQLQEFKRANARHCHCHAL